MTVTCYRFSIDLAGSKIDPNNRTIRQVSLISLGEAKGHDVFVDQKTLSQVFDKLTELGSLKVKADHGSGVLSTIGYIDQFEMGQDKVIGDFHIYESETEAPRIFEIARKNPHHLGMSLEFEGEDQKKDGKMFARCSDISAVALVSDPAANKSLFEKSTNSVDSKTKPDNSQSMANKKLDDKPEVKEDEKKLDDKPTDSGANDFQKRFDEFATRFDAFMKKYDEGAVNKPDDGKPALPATNPNAEPKANNNGPTMKNGEKGEMKGEEPDANPKGAWEEDEKKFQARIDAAANFASEKTLRTFASALGIRNLPSQGAPFNSENKGTEKDFETLVAEKTKELEAKGDKNPKNNATVFCMKNHTKEYAAWRPVQSKPAPRTL